jgi:hypothetical protein
MKLLLRNDVHVRDRSYDVSIYEAPGNSRVKITYEAYNASERCVAEMWSGQKWNTILSMWDLGVRPDSSIYVTDEANRRKRFEKELLPKIFEIIKIIVR